MRIRRGIVAASVALTGATAAGEAPVTTTTVVAEERCNGDDILLPEHDVCTVTMTSVTGGVAAPTLEVRVTTAAADRGVPTGAVLAWRAGDCGFVVDHDGGTGVGPAGSAPDALLTVSCGEPVRACTVDALGYTLNCRFTYEDETTVEIEPAVRDGEALVLDLAFVGNLAPWASYHDEGAQIGLGIAAVGPRASADRPVGTTLAAASCGTDTPCIDVVGDLVSGDRVHVVG